MSKESSLLISVICAGEFELSDSVFVLEFSATADLGDPEDPEKAPLLLEYNK